MRLLLVIFGLSTTISAWADDEVQRCQLLFRHVVLERRAMRGEDLLAFIAAGPGANPADYATWRGQTDKRAFQRPFAALLAGPQGAHVAEALRAEAERLAGVAAVRDRSRAEAKGTTRQIVAIRHLREIPLETVGAPMLFAENGEPRVAVGRWTSAQAITLLNPLDDASARNLWVPGYVYTAPTYTEHGGYPWLLYTGSRASGTDDTGVTGVRLNGDRVLEAGEGSLNNGATGTPQLVSIRQEPWIVTNNLREKSISIYPFGRAIPPRHFARGEVHRGDVLKVWTGSKGPLFSTTRPGYAKSLVVVDPTAEATIIHTTGTQAKFVTWADDGARKPILVLGGENGVSTLSPLEHGAAPKPLLPGAALNSPTIFEQEGKRFVAVAIREPSGERAVLVNLANGTRIDLGGASGISTPISGFSFRGREYYCWGTYDGAIAVVDSASPGTAIRRKVVRSVGVVLPFITNDGVLAVVQGTEPLTPLSVVQLVGPSDGRDPKHPH